MIIDLRGPSPRAWGEHYEAAKPGGTRTIPTRVGRTIGATRLDLASHGPSPRAWGEPRRGKLPHGPRTIPTRVGRTRPSRGRVPRTDHPHARGENAARAGRCRNGPSPRAWGEQLRSNPVPVTDHPHARGENNQSAPRLRPVPDHPHARGEKLGRGRRRADARTIPTRVGRTVTDKAPSALRGPSPRAWGELWPRRSR